MGLLGLMPIRQFLTLEEATVFWSTHTVSQPTEIPGLIVSCLALTFVYFLDQYLHEQKAVILPRRASAERYQFLYDNAPNLFASVYAEIGNIRECNKTLSLGWDEQWCGNILWA